MKTMGDTFLRRTVAFLGVALFIFIQISSLLIRKLAIFTVVTNKGIAFSIPFKGIAQLSLSFCLLLVIVYFSPQLLSTVKKQSYPYGILGLSMILGGGLSNLFERIAYGHVFDYFDIKIWPIFNIADISITIGVIFIAMLWILMEYDTIKEKKKVK